MGYSLSTMHTNGHRSHTPSPSADHTHEPTRVCLFTDTLGDVNGVSRFIRNIAEQALKHNCTLHVLTSTRFTCPDQPNVHNPTPIYTRPMPGYATLDIVLPPNKQLHAIADRINPHVVHVSTPGPVGSVGRSYAIKRGLPILGTYHTDFPAYISHLFNDDALTWVCDQAMRRFYKPFRRVFSRSDDYAAALQRLGVDASRIDRLLPGIDTDVFNTSFRDAGGAVWKNVPGVRPGSVKALYVGRVSVEKNLPLLSRVWPAAKAACQAAGVDAQLIIVGDGPYRKPMEETLHGTDTVFAGFRYGVELSTIYASSDLFVFPSTTDTLGQVVMESQAAGLPVIVTDQGGPSEVVDDNRTGYVLPAAGHAAEERWGSTIARVLCDAQLRSAMGRAGAAKIAPMSIRHSFEHFWLVHEGVAKNEARAHDPGLVTSR